jgi:hypothetical protein
MDNINAENYFPKPLFGIKKDKESSTCQPSCPNAGKNQCGGCDGEDSCKENIEKYAKRTESDFRYFLEIEHSNEQVLDEIKSSFKTEKEKAYLTKMLNRVLENSNKIFFDAYLQEYSTHASMMQTKVELPKKNEEKIKEIIEVMKVTSLGADSEICDLFVKLAEKINEKYDSNLVEATIKEINHAKTAFHLMVTLDYLDHLEEKSKLSNIFNVTS